MLIDILADVILRLIEEDKPAFKRLESALHKRDFSRFGAESRKLLILLVQLLPC